jgi:LuxR family maltose regulon positive regulatory protein
MSTVERVLRSSHHRLTGHTWDAPALTYITTHTLPPGETWRIRREIVRAGRAIMSMHLQEAPKSISLARRLLCKCEKSRYARYDRTLRMLEAFILVAEDDLSAARRVLLDLDLRADDALASAMLRYLDWKQDERDRPGAPDTADYLTAPVGRRALSRILSLCVSAAVAFDHLQLSVAASLATEALQLARTRYGNNSAPTTFPATLLAQVAYEQGRHDEAEALVRPRISVIRASGILECVARASVLLARLSLHRGRHRAALAMLRETEALGLARCWPRLVAIASAECTRTIEGLRFDEAQRDARTPTRSKPAFPTLSSRRPLELIAEIPGDNLKRDQAVTFSVVEDALHRASAAATLGLAEESYELLISCLRIGAARGLCMAFVDAGRPLFALLERLYHALPASDPQLADLRPYVATLLRSTVQSRSEDSTSVSYRSLSERETGILRMIALGMSNKRIAQSLGITPETVKSHAKSIFVKLASHTRAQAVARAEAVGLL